MKIKHVKGNVLRLEIPLTIKRKELVDGHVVENVEDFYPCPDYPTYINFKKSLTIPFEASVQGNLARMQDNGTLNVGTYQIEVMCCDEAGNPYRYMVRDIVEVVDATADADIEEGVEFNAETYTLEGAVFISYGVEQVQADWTETDIHSKAYINNKPTNLVEDESYVHTDNNYTDEEKEKLADLENYDDSGIRQELRGKADKSEMSVVPGTGADADKTTITLKQGTSATVLTTHQDISGKEDVTNIVTPVNAADATLPITTFTCDVGKYYRIDVAVDNLGVTLPAMTDLTTVRTVVICLTAGTTPAVTITAADNKDVYYQDSFEIVAGNTYEINALFNGAAWIVASVKINVE